MARSAEAASVPQIPIRWYHDWVAKNIPDQSGRVAIVTGSNSGTGFWCAAALAGKGAEVILACRSVEKGQAAASEIVQMHPQAKVEAMCMDNMDLSSVRGFADNFKKKFTRLDLLINNAGIMAQPLVQSRDGFDVQFQTNHLAHFLLTQLLWDRLLEPKPSGPARVVQHSSGAHQMGSFSRATMQRPAAPSYLLGFAFRCILPIMGMPQDNWRRYGMSKLCNVLFGLELHRRIEAAGLSGRVMSTMCHPGYASTQLQYRAGEAGGMKGWEKWNSSRAQSAADGSLPLLMAAVGEVQSGVYTGPSEGMTGPPKIDKVGGQGNNAAMAADLWSYSEECCGTKFDVVKV